MARYDGEAAGNSRATPISLGDYAIRALREDLIEGRLLSGQGIAVGVLATEMGISHVLVGRRSGYLRPKALVERIPQPDSRPAAGSKRGRGDLSGPRDPGKRSLPTPCRGVNGALPSLLTMDDGKPGSRA